jgi:hypothetical protein
MRYSCEGGRGIRRPMRASVIAAAAVPFLLACSHDSATSTSTSTSTATATATATATPSASGSSFFDDVPPIPSETASAAAQVDAGTVAYVRYTNDRFHVSVEVPSFFDKSPAQANGAGQSFTWKGKASMRVWGAPNSQHWAPAQYFDDFARRPGVTEKQQKDEWWFVTGKDRGHFFYTKGLVAPAALVAVMIDYDDAVKDTMDVAARHIGESLKTGQ